MALQKNFGAGNNPEASTYWIVYGFDRNLRTGNNLIVWIGFKDGTEREELRPLGTYRECLVQNIAFVPVGTEINEVLGELYTYAKTTDMWSDAIDC